MLIDPLTSDGKRWRAVRQVPGGPMPLTAAASAPFFPANDGRKIAWLRVIRPRPARRAARRRSASVLSGHAQAYGKDGVTHLRKGGKTRFAVQVPTARNHLKRRT